MGSEGLQNSRGGQSNFTPSKRGSEKALAMLNRGVVGGHTQFLMRDT